METLNNFNHGRKGNPHPQYDSFLTYQCPNNPNYNERYILIFEGNFHYRPHELDIEKREYSRLLYKAMLYNMISDDPEQIISDFTLCCFVDYKNDLQLKVNNTTIFGTDDRLIKCYYYTDQSTSITNVRVYAMLLTNYESLKIKPVIYDTIMDDDTRLHLKAAHDGVNTKEKLDDLYRDFSTRKLLLKKELDEEMNNYTMVKVNSNSVSNIVINNSKYPGISFEKNGENQGKIYYNSDSRWMAFDGMNGGSVNWSINGNILPRTADTNIGAEWAKYSKGYFSKGVCVGTCGRYNRPSQGVENGFTTFDADLKKLITYYDGKWYSDGAEV